MDRSAGNVNTYRILSLDGGGAKGFYTLGVLTQLEALLGGKPLCEQFDLIFGTSTGAIIASLLGLGKRTSEVLALYREHVPNVMSKRTSKGRSEALERTAAKIYGKLKFDAMKTGIGLVAARWLEERQLVFKADVRQAHGMQSTFLPGFGCTVADAVVASCSAYPLFERKIVTVADGSTIELLDGGYCANNPTLYAIADAVQALGLQRDQLRVVSIGVGNYPEPTKYWHNWAISKFFLVRLLQKTLAINTHSVEQLADILFRDVPLVRVNETYSTSEMATDLLEDDSRQLDVLFQRGIQSFGKYETQIKVLLSTTAKNAPP